MQIISPSQFVSMKLKKKGQVCDTHMPFISQKLYFQLYPIDPCKTTWRTQSGACFATQKYKNRTINPHKRPHAHSDHLSVTVWQVLCFANHLVAIRVHSVHIYAHFISYPKNFDLTICHNSLHRCAQCQPAPYK